MIYNQCWWRDKDIYGFKVILQVRPTELQCTEGCIAYRTARWCSVKSYPCVPVPLHCELVFASGGVDALPWMGFYHYYFHSSPYQSISPVFLLLTSHMETGVYFLLALVGEGSWISSLTRDSHTCHQLLNKIRVCQCQPVTGLCPYYFFPCHLGLMLPSRYRLSMPVYLRHPECIGNFNLTVS